MKGCPEGAFILDDSEKFCKMKNNNNSSDTEHKKCSILIEMEIEDTLTLLEENVSISEIKNLEEIIKDNECNPLRKDLAERLGKVSKLAMEKAMSGEIEPDPLLLNMASTDISNKLNR